MPLNVALFLNDKGHHMATGMCLSASLIIIIIFLPIPISSFTCTLASEHVPSSSHFTKHTAKRFFSNAWQAGTF